RRPTMGSVRRHRLALELVLLALVGYLAAVGVTTGLGTAVDDVPPAPAAAPAPGAHPPGPLADYALIAERDIFNPTPRGGAAAAPADERIRRTAENAFIVDRREVAGAVDNVSGLMTQLRAVAEVRDGRPAGFRLFQIRDDSLFARLGLQNGDVVQRVNGAQVADPAALLGFLQRLRTEPRVALDIVRGDAPRTLVYDLR